MKARTILWAAALVWAAGAPQSRGAEEVAWFTGTLEEAQKQAAERKTIVMIDFYTEWCGWCGVMDRETYGNAEVAKALGEVVAIKINPEKGNEAIAEKYEVEAYPTIVFMDAEGKVIERWEGFVRPKQFLEVLERARKGEGTLGAVLEALGRDPADPEAHTRMAERLMTRGETAKAEEHLRKVVEADPANAKGYTDDAEFRLTALEATAGLMAVGALKQKLSAVKEAFEVPEEQPEEGKEMAPETAKAIEEARTALEAILAAAKKNLDAATKESRAVFDKATAAVYRASATRIEGFLTKYPETNMREQACQWLSRIYGELGEKEKAGAARRELLKVKPDDPEVLNNLAWEM
ncbi:MAG: thioredoxin fold domain-containing protein, partial [Planctomycetota bacterium]